MEVDLTPFALASQGSAPLRATWFTSTDLVLPSGNNDKAHSLTRIRQQSILSALAKVLYLPCQPVLMDGYWLDGSQAAIAHQTPVQTSRSAGQELIGSRAHMLRDLDCLNHSRAMLRSL